MRRIACVLVVSAALSMTVPVSPVAMLSPRPCIVMLLDERARPWGFQQRRRRHYRNHRGA